MDLVVDDEAPGSRPKQLEVWKIALAMRSPRQDLIGGERRWTGALLLSAVLRDLVRQQASLVADLSAPLRDRGQARCEHERRLTKDLHGREADDGLACATRQQDYATAAASRAGGIEGTGCLPRVLADAERCTRNRPIAK